MARQKMVIKAFRGAVARVQAGPGVHEPLNDRVKIVIRCSLVP